MDQLGQAGSAVERSKLLVELHDVQVNDQLAALAYLRSQPDVDVGRLAVAGCSFSGAQSWQGSRDLQQRMIRAVRNATIPIAFIEAENDYDLSPSRVLAVEMQRAGKPHLLKIYPRSGSTREEAHDFCVRGADLWEADVFAFLAANLR